jgi:hypothetical protein
MERVGGSNPSRRTIFTGVNIVDCENCNCKKEENKGALPWVFLLVIVCAVIVVVLLRG